MPPRGCERTDVQYVAVWHRCGSSCHPAPPLRLDRTRRPLGELVSAIRAIASHTPPIVVDGCETRGDYGKNLKDFPDWLQNKGVGVYG